MKTGRPPALERTQCINIRSLFTDHHIKPEHLAQRFNVSSSVITRVLKGTYSQVTDLPNLITRQKEV